MKLHLIGIALSNVYVRDTVCCFFSLLFCTHLLSPLLLWWCKYILYFTHTSNALAIL